MSTPAEKQAGRRSNWPVVLLLLAVPITLFVLIKRKIIPYNQREINKRYFNPLVLKFAGSRRTNNGVIFHEGRKSGRSYATPVTPLPVSDGFVIALPYGDDTDWGRNILAAGQCTIQWRGETYTLDNPEVLDLQTVLSELSPLNRRLLSIIKPQKVMKLHFAAEKAIR